MLAAFLTLCGGVSGLVRMAVAAVLVAGVVWPIAHHAGVSAGRARLQAEITAANLQAERERIKDDAHRTGLSDYDACVSALRSRRLPVAACDELRRVPAGEPVPGRDGGSHPR